MPIRLYVTFMPKTLIRILTIAMVPCLLMEPSFAHGMTLAAFRSSSIPRARDVFLCRAVSMPPDFSGRSEVLNSWRTPWHDRQVICRYIIGIVGLAPVVFGQENSEHRHPKAIFESYSNQLHTLWKSVISIP